MPKMKSNRSAKKRFHLTANGKVRRNHAFLRHQLTHKTRERKRRLRHATLASSTDVQRIKRMLLA
jgi:large subunit ribosomal protein L35